MPSVYTFGSGWTHIRFDDDRDLHFLDTRCFLLLPAGFNERTIPDELIHPREDIQMNREPVNQWWAGYRERACSAGAKA